MEVVGRYSKLGGYLEFYFICFLINKIVCYLLSFDRMLG